MPRLKPDRRIARTQQSLHVALNTLILEKGYESVTVEDITRRANVGRSTLYQHHGGKHGLLLHGLQHVREALLAAQRESVNRPLGFSRAFFEHVHDYREIHQALLRSESGPAVTTALKRIVSDLVARDGAVAKPDSRDAIPRDARIRFLVDAFFSILGWWHAQKPTLTPAEADRIFRRLVLQE